MSDSVSLQATVGEDQVFKVIKNTINLTKELPLFVKVDINNVRMGISPDSDPEKLFTFYKHQRKGRGDFSG